jgi:hypothetical protein
MSPPPTIYTTPAELDGTLTGIIITAVVAALGLVMLVGLVYWANRHPDARKPRADGAGKLNGAVRPADPRSVASRPEKPLNSPDDPRGPIDQPMH